MRNPGRLDHQTQAVLFAWIRLVGLGVGLVTSVIIVRSLTVSNYGQYAVAAAISVIVGAFGIFGIDQLYLSGRVTEQELHRLVWRIAVALVLVGAAAGSIWPGLANRERVVVYILATASGVECMRSLWLLKPQRLGRFSTRAGRELLSQVGIAAGSCVGAVLAPSAVGVALGALSAQLILTITASGAGRIGSAREEGTEVRGATTFQRLRQGAPYAASGGLYTIYFSVDLALLGSISPPSEAAHYRVAYAFVAIAVAIPIAINNEVFRPKIFAVVHYGHPDSAEIHRVSRQFLRLSLALGLGVTIGMATVAPTLIGPVFGDRYGAARALVGILALGMLPHYYSSWAGNFLVSVGGVVGVLKLQLALALGNVCANAALIPSYGAKGAALATVGTEMLSCVLYMYMVRTSRWGSSER